MNAVADNTDVASSQCPNVWKYGSILDKQNIKLMSSFAKEQCPTFDKSKYQKKAKLALKRILAR